MPKKTKENPHGLSAKQKLVAEDIARTVYEGKKIDPVGSTSKFYAVNSKKSAAAISSYNMAKKDFRMAIIEELGRYGVFEGDSTVSRRLSEGLDAMTERGGIDYNARLKYIQEINKITDVYAPLRTEKKTMNLTIDLTEEELNKRIEELTKELE